MAFITDDVCEEVVLCRPNIIEQKCLPMGEGLECAFTEILSVRWWYWDWNNYHNYYNNWDEYPVDYNTDVNFEVGLMTRPAGYSNFYLAEVDTGIGDDDVSGIGLLHYLRLHEGQLAASLDPSLLRGLPIHFKIDGGSGDDYITGANNADILYGGSGNDKVWGLGGDDTIDGGSGNDRLYGGNGNDIIYGGADNDYISGGNGNDKLIGNTGHDTIYGNNGNDNLYGGIGDDYLDGGNHHDWMSGDVGEDTMYGGAGNDCMSGGAHDDDMYGGSGNDLMDGGSGDDYMRGGSDDDKMEGGDGDDDVYGDSGNDLVSGGAGNDYVDGGDGDDIVRGGLGDDVMYGGEGCDQFAFCEIDYECYDHILDFSVLDRDQIDIKALDITSVRVVKTGHDSSVFLDLMDGDEEAGRIRVDSGDYYADLESVFEVDTAFGTGNGAVVQIGTGVMVDLPSTSVLYAESGMFI